MNFAFHGTVIQVTASWTLTTAIQEDPSQASKRGPETKRVLRRLPASVSLPPCVCHQVGAETGWVLEATEQSPVLSLWCVNDIALVESPSQFLPSSHAMWERHLHGRLDAKMTRMHVQSVCIWRRGDPQLRQVWPGVGTLDAHIQLHTWTSLSHSPSNSLRVGFSPCSRIFLYITFMTPDKTGSSVNS